MVIFRRSFRQISLIAVPTHRQQAISQGCFVPFRVNSLCLHFLSFEMLPSSDALAILKRVGLVLVMVGLMDIILMVYAIANQTPYSSTLNIFAVVAGVFLSRGSLRMASAVRWLSFFILSTLGAAMVATPVMLPMGLIATYVQLKSFDVMVSLGIAMSSLVIFGWIAVQLSDESIGAARLAVGRRQRDARIPLLAGIALVAALAGLNLTVQRTDSAARAIGEARMELGDDFEFYVSSINYRSSANTTDVSGVVTAWKSGVIRTHSFRWRE
ncbi:MAG: hypothetical protein Q8S92_19960 [Hydrogenophaga sp.]|uniref:hypothetical protein n=1 Tax=Hydrogenophaga sp. TaxID=1904254 RepID=UPI002735E1BD|nr:hypothetical protein [Hydrogenophaga sp.]MDP1781416.1 hypothetical protein [Hydrogenophaga sp.]MDP3351268.1 hypothetical protein [Hydrogenophaga sp.]